MKEKIYIRCQFQQMPESEVLDMIPAETIQRIRVKDPHPEFRVFSLGHEGEANANVLGMGMKVLRYAKELIVQMFHKIRFGLPVFNRHDPNTNSHVNREVVGEVVGKAPKIIQGIQHMLAAVYIKPEYRANNLDIASIEGDFEAEEAEDGTMGVVNLSQITGIALSNHAVDTPGMPGATLQAALQMFTQKYGRVQQMAMTKEQIKAAITEAGVKIHDLYTEEEIVASEPAKKAKQTEYEWAKRIETKLGESREENAKLQGKISTLEGEKATLAEKANQGTIKEVLAGIATERKLDPKFTAFAEKNIRNFKSAKTGDDFKVELEKFVDVTAKDYVEMGKIYGFEAKVTTEAQKKEEGKEEGGAGAPAADGKGGAATGGDEGKSTYEDPKKNDFIPA